MKINKTNFIETKIRLLPETDNALKTLAKKNGISVAVLTRNILEKHLSQETIDENAGVVATTVRKIVKEVIHSEADRLAKLIIKSMKASAAGMYLSVQAVEDIGQHKGAEILNEAIKMAVKYIKVSYDPKEYIDVPSKAFGDVTTITDDDLFTMTI